MIRMAVSSRQERPRGTGSLDFVLRFTGPQPFREFIEDLVLSEARYLNVVPDVSRLGAIQVEVGFDSIGVNSIAALDHPERHQCVEEIGDASGVKSAAFLDLVAIQRPFGQFGEEPELDRAEKDF